ncbi:FecCD family ABC transporter permease [Allokutzneria oryzae]|uniref:FecCD family ABC transporter permease n=1 Tax=Allokutzneria oryzae TaxID=1378989 RepID=A0ABV6A311_9PSEU
MTLRRLAVALLVLAVVAVGSVLIGTEHLGVGVLVDAYLRPDGSDAQLVIRHLRVPRTLTGLLAGVALGLAGAVTQGLTRNPLAGPEVLGVNAGAALAVVIGIATAGLSSVSGYVWFAFAGAALAGLLTAVLGAGAPVRLALAGVAVTAMLGGVTSALTLLDASAFAEYRYWVVGSLSAATLSTVVQALPFVALGAVLALASARALNATALGDDTARALGQHLARTRAVAAIAVVLLTGAAVAMAGPIAFVGLTVPHIARALAGPDYRWVLPWSMVLAPTLLLAADVLGRLVARPMELQAGIVTAVLGAPVFIALVRRRRLVAL